MDLTIEPTNHLSKVLDIWETINALKMVYEELVPFVDEAGGQYYIHPGKYHKIRLDVWLEDRVTHVELG